MKYKIKTLKSGARFLFVVDKNSPSVEITILFKIGSRSDGQGKQGISHLLEHLNFQGTNVRKNNKQIVLEVENLGGQIDAFTGYEHLGFSIKCPADNVLQSLDILFDMVLNPTYLEKELEKEKRVIIEEIKMYDDIPSEKARDAFQNLLFPDNNLGYNIAGSVATLGSITREDIFKHKDGIICQDNILVSVAGNFDKSTIEKKLLVYLDKMKTTSSIVPVKFVRSANKEKIINIKREIAQSNIVFGTYGTKRSFKKDYALRLGNIMLSGGMGSLLFQKIREDLRLAYYVNSSHTEFSEIGIFQVEMGVDDNKIYKAVDEARTVLNKFARGHFTKGDFIRAKNYLLGMLVTQIETSSDIASLNAYNLIHRKGEVFETKEHIINEVEKVTVDAITDIWGAILKDQQFFYVNVGNKELRL